MRSLWTRDLLGNRKLRRGLAVIVVIALIYALIAGWRPGESIGPLLFAGFVCYRLWFRGTTRREAGSRGPTRFGTCVKCGYDCRGAQTTRCPECGTWQAPVAPSMFRKGRGS